MAKQAIVIGDTGEEAKDKLNDNFDELYDFIDDDVVLKNAYVANSILAATVIETPAAITIAENGIIGRPASGEIKSLTRSEQIAILWKSELESGVSGVYDVDFSEDANLVVLTGNITSLTFSNLVLLYPVTRTFVMNGYSITFPTKFYPYDNSTDLDDSTTVDDAAFVGTGIDDLTSGGTFVFTTENLDILVEIDGTGTPDTFKWSKDAGTTFEAETVSITGAAQTLTNGITITFTATTGHTLTDYWRFRATAVMNDILFKPVHIATGREDIRYNNAISL